ncbi:hypothetical protein QP028_09970 [Corynebacterium suedekumii]|nr:hypothetical protein QP028_09970 [Corynebacterium suedekumii]
MTRSKEKTTSSAVTGEPSWKRGALAEGDVDGGLVPGVGFLGGQCHVGLAGGGVHLGEGFEGVPVGGDGQGRGGGHRVVAVGAQFVGDSGVDGAVLGGGATPPSPVV